MTKRQRRVLEVLGVLVALAAVAAGIAVVTGPNDTVAVRTGQGDAVSDGPSTTTTTDLRPATSSTSPADPVPTTSEPPTSAPPPTTAPPGVEVTGDGAVLERANFTPPRPLLSDCRSLADDGWSTVGCDRVPAKGADLIWLVEQRGQALRALVLRPSTAGAWVVILASDEDGARWREIRVKVADVSGDGPPEIAFGFRQQGGSEMLALDLVEGPGRVVVHDNLRRGVARVQTGAIETWEETGPHSDRFVSGLIHFDAGAYRRVEGETVPASSVPEGDL